MKKKIQTQNILRRGIAFVKKNRLQLIAGAGQSDIQQSQGLRKNAVFPINRCMTAYIPVTMLALSDFVCTLNTFLYSPIIPNI